MLDMYGVNTALSEIWMTVLLGALNIIVILILKFLIPKGLESGLEQLHIRLNLAKPGLVNSHLYPLCVEINTGK